MTREGARTFIGLFGNRQPMWRGCYQPIKAATINQAAYYMREKYGQSWQSVYALEQFRIEQEDRYDKPLRPLPFIGEN